MSAPDEIATVYVCQGPPRCDLEGDEAAEAAAAGCVWCRKRVIFNDGTERVDEPGNA